VPPNGFTEIPPLLDGAVGPGEWDRALPVASFNAGQIFFLNDPNWLYLLVDLPADTLPDLPQEVPPYGDYFLLVFDTDYDGQIVPERDLVLGIDHTGAVVVTNGPYPPPVGAVLRPTRSETVSGLGVSGLSQQPHRLREFKIPFSELGNVSVGGEVRLGFLVASQSPRFLEKRPENLVIPLTDPNSLLRFTLGKP